MGADVNICDFDSKKRTPLLIAAELGNKQLIETLIKHGAKIDAKDVNGNTLLHMCAEKGDTDLLKYFIKEYKYKRKSVDQKNENGMTPFQVCFQHKNKPFFNDLVSQFIIANAGITLL